MAGNWRAGRWREFENIDQVAGEPGFNLLRPVDMPVNVQRLHIMSERAGLMPRSKICKSVMQQASSFRGIRDAVG